MPRVLTYRPECSGTPDPSTTGSVDDLLRAHRAQRADVIVVHDPQVEPARTVLRVLQQDATASVFVAGCPTDATVLAEAISLGARGFVHRGHPDLPTRPVRRPRSGSTPLTAREHDVLVAMSRGLSNAEIAAQLRVSVATVKVYAQHVFTKLGSRERAQAVAVAFRDGLLS